MPISKITKTADGRGAIKYAEEGHGHDGSEMRNVEIGCVNLDLNRDFADQMQVYWDKAIHRHKIQIMRVIQSFAFEELNPNDPNDIHKANMIGVEFARKYYPGRQAVVFTQIDGKGGKIHNHVLISDVHMETYKGHTDDQSHYWYVEKCTDEVAERYIEKIRNPRKENQQAKDKVTQTERVKREQGKYVWKDSLKSRVLGAMEASRSEVEFYQELAKRGVTAEKKVSKKYGTYFTYTLDKKYVPKGEKVREKLSARSYKMGSAYGYDALMYSIEHGKTEHSRPETVQSAGGTGRRKPPEPAQDAPKPVPEEPVMKVQASKPKDAEKQSAPVQEETQKQAEQVKVKSAEDLRREELHRWMDYMNVNRINKREHEEEWSAEFGRLHDMFQKGSRAPDGWKRGDDDYYTEMEKKKAEEQARERQSASEASAKMTAKTEADLDAQVVQPLKNSASDIAVNAAADAEARRKEEVRRKLREKAMQQQKLQVESLRKKGKPIPANFEDILQESIRRHEDGDGKEMGG